ncbi:SAGA-associated factor 29 isoform X1 [Meles meles]|uniref:SAGA-associated factor 29 isoform X1 n=1 Tax=Meles meles TaxID=9662 RepID=UPI001E69DB72|nr:SAGA-associated factor 29 isoform X1 [Meles meles]
MGFHDVLKVTQLRGPCSLSRNCLAQPPRKPGKELQRFPGCSLSETCPFYLQPHSEPREPPRPRRVIWSLEHVLFLVPAWVEPGLQLLRSNFAGCWGRPARLLPAVSILRKALDKIAEIKSLLEERRIAAKIAGLYNDSEPPRKTMRRGVLMTLLQQSAMTLPLWIGKPGDKPPPLCGAIPASGDYVAKPGDKVAARVKAVDGDEQWILAEVVSYSHATNKYEVDDIDEEGKERHTLSRRRIIPLPQWKANPETDPEALFQKEQLVLALYPQTTCFYRALIHTPPQRPQDDYSVLFEDTSYADGYSPPLNVAQRYVVACKEPKKK